MGINLAADVAYATSAVSPVAVTAELEVFERAVLTADTKGQVCPSTGDTGSGALTWQGSSLSAMPAFGFERSGMAVRQSAVIGANSVLNNVQPSKPRTGYRAPSGTG